MVQFNVNRESDMTDEEVAQLLCEAYDRAKSPAWVSGDVGDDNPDTRLQSRVAERWLGVVRIARDRLEANKREQTAATILAALIAAGRSVQAQHVDDLRPGIVNTTREAVMLADHLRAELAKVPR